MNDDADVEIFKQRERLAAETHAMQSGVAFDPDQGDRTPKHLRVGVNAALVETGVLAKILIDKGIITQLEYVTALADGMEAERMKYEAELTQKFGKPVKLG